MFLIFSLFLCFFVFVCSWLVRNSYGIQGDACNDCWTAIFCPCCSANQLYQTTKQYGSISTDGGLIHNTGTWINNYGSGTLHDCIYAFFCMPCSNGKILERSIGMPWYMGCLCTNACTARNLIRYQYRIAGNDVLEECAVPYALKFFGDITQSCIPFIWFIIYGIFVVGTMQQLKEVESRSNQSTTTSTSPPRYLIRDTTTQIRPASVVASTNNVIVYLPDNNASAPSSSISYLPNGSVEMFQPVQVHNSLTSSGYSRLDNNNNNNNSNTTRNPVIGIPIHDKL